MVFQTFLVSEINRDGFFLPGRFPHLKRYQSWKLYCWHSTHLRILGLHPEGIFHETSSVTPIFGQDFCRSVLDSDILMKILFLGCFLQFYHWSGYLHEILELHGPEFLRHGINSEALSGLVLVMLYGQAGPVLTKLAQKLNAWLSWPFRRSAS